MDKNFWVLSVELKFLILRFLRNITQTGIYSVYLKFLILLFPFHCSNPLFWSTFYVSTYNSNVIKLVKIKNKVVKFQDPACLNCGHPFTGHENFCPECGQENKGNKISFKNFVGELFSGFFNFDAKFWTTLIPLLTKPGKVSRDYIEGKRQLYTNPFRFYLTVSIVFFLLVGLSSTINKYKDNSEDLWLLNQYKWSRH